MKKIFFFLCFVSASLGAQTITSNGNLFGLDAPDGSTILPVAYDAVTEIGSVKKVYRYRKDSLFGLINLYTHENSGLVYNEANTFSDSKLIVLVKGNKTGYVLLDKRVNPFHPDTFMLVNPQYDWISPEATGIVVQQNNLYGIYSKIASRHYAPIIPVAVPYRILFDEKLGFYYRDSLNMYYKLYPDSSVNGYHVLRLSEKEVFIFPGYAIHNDFRNSRFVNFDFNTGKENFSIPYRHPYQNPTDILKISGYRDWLVITEINTKPADGDELYCPFVYDFYSISTGEYLSAVLSPKEGLRLYLEPMAQGFFRRKRLSRKVHYKLPRWAPNSGKYFMILLDKGTKTDCYYVGILDGKQIKPFDKCHKNLRTQSRLTGLIELPDITPEIKLFSD